MAESAVFEPVRRNGDHIPVAARANELLADAQASRPRSAGGLLRPSQVPVPGGTTSVTGPPSPGAYFSTDFSQVPVHTDSAARAPVAEADAPACTSGRLRLAGALLRPSQVSVPGAATRTADEAGPTTHDATCGHAQQVTPVQRSTVHNVLGVTGRPLPEQVRTEMEGRFSGADFTDVQIHDDNAARASAAAVGARAYTSGVHVVIGPGEIDKRTLAHELTHVIQQRRGPVAGTGSGNGLVLSSPGDPFEREAEANARRVLSGPAPQAHEQAHAHAGRAAVQRAAVGLRATAVQRARGTQTPARPAKVTKDQLLNMIVGQNRTLAGFPFGPESRNGPSNIISRDIEVKVSEGAKTGRLAVHLNVMLETGDEVQNGNDSSTVSIKGKLFHLTARPASSQRLINQAGASILTAEESVHVGRSNAVKGWNNNHDNFQLLANAIGIPAQAVLAALQNRFPPNEMNDRIQQFKRDVGRVVIHALPPDVVNVEWLDSDKSFE